MDSLEKATFDPLLNIKQEPELLIESTFQDSPSEGDDEPDSVSSSETKPAFNQQEDNLDESKYIPQSSHNFKIDSNSSSSSSSPERKKSMTSGQYKKYKFDKKLQCNQCEKKYSTKLSLSFHKKLKHEIEESQDQKSSSSVSRSKLLTSCKLCGKKVLNIDAHLSSFHTQIRYDCDKCSFSTKYLNNLRTHQISIHTKSKYSCDYCAKKFNDQSNRNRHMKQHLEAPLEIKCQLCSKLKTFSRQDNLKLHLKRIHGMDPNGTEPMMRLECDLCGVIYVTKSSLKNHMKETHIDLSGRTIHKCSICTKQYFLKQSLIEHLYAVHLKKFCCRFCCKILGRPGTLKKHEDKCQNN